MMGGCGYSCISYHAIWTTRIPASGVLASSEQNPSADRKPLEIPHRCPVT
jgi:hypothetical protein